MKDIRNVHKSNPQGSITVFLSLILFTIVSFIFVLIDFTRINSAKNQLVIASDNAAESAMAEFNKTLFDEYGLFAYDGTGSQDTATRVFNMNIDPNFGVSVPKESADLLNIEGNSIINPMSPLFTGTDVFKQQMIYAMKYQGTENLAINVFDKINGLIGVAEQAGISEDIKDINDELSKIKKELANVENAKLDSQRSIIALALASNTPQLYYLDRFQKNEHLDSKAENNKTVKVANENIGKLYFKGMDDDFKRARDQEYIKNPYQNIYMYKYTVQMVNSYRRSFEEEYNNEKAKHESKIKDYEDKLAKYNSDKIIYDKAWANYERDNNNYEKDSKKYEEDLKKYEEAKELDPNTTVTKPTKPTKPTEPTVKKPTEPTKPPMPDILKMDLNEVITSLNNFNNALNSESLLLAKEIVNNNSKYIGHYISSLEEGKKELDYLLNDKAGARNTILSKLEELKAKADASSSSEDIKTEITNLYNDTKKIMNDESLNELSRSITYLKSELIRFQSEVYGSTGATSKLLNSIDSIINSSTTKIDKSKSTVGPFMENIYVGIYTRSSSTSYGSRNVDAKKITEENLTKGSYLLNVSELDGFKKQLIDIHKDMKILENINEKVLGENIFDVGDKDDNQNSVGEFTETLDKDDGKGNDGASLTAILARYDKTGVLSVSLPLPGTGLAGGEEGGISDFEKLTGYKDAFAGHEFDQSMLDKIYLTEYIMTYFKDMVDYVDEGNRIPVKTDHESQLEYEIEALVRSNGVYDDKKNKESMKHWIKNIRIACNTITILDTIKMKDFTYKVAKTTSEIIANGFTLFVPGGASIASAIRSKPFIKIIQFGIIISWANMEANLDAADIFRGFYVPLIKKPEEWIMKMGLNLSAPDDEAGKDEVNKAKDNMKEPVKGGDEAHNEQPDDSKSGAAKKLLMANYPDYLRARLLIKLLTNEEAVINATKDLVYANMEKVDGEFNYNNYYTGMEISVDSSVDTWFKNDAFGSGGKVNFNKFTYKKRYN